MNHPLFCVCFILLLTISCSNRKQRHPLTAPRPVIGILPFEGSDKDVVTAIQQNLEERYHADIKVLPGKRMPDDAFYPARNRYIADSLLLFLKREDSNRFERIIGITIHDIATRKGPHVNWGIMGFGYCPGKSCVISTFRVKATAKDRAHFIKRMIILAMHELGHTWSLPHCTSEVCIMKDAEGKMNLDNTDRYCTMCELRLREQGILKSE